MGRGRTFALHFLATLILVASTAAATAEDSSCCSDIEQRIAELESMVARKGNRKVALQITGLVNNAIMAWDDGAERNAYIVTNDNQRSRFSFVGKARSMRSGRQATRSTSGSGLPTPSWSTS